MNVFQKIVKYLAMAFALFLVFSIVAGIASGLLAIANIFSNSDNYERIDYVKQFKIDGEVKILNVDISNSNILIKVGNSFKIETSNDYISFKQDSNKIYIREKKHNWFNNDNNQLIIYIPQDMIFDVVDISNGAGKLKVEKLSSEILTLELGAGKVNIDNLTVYDSTSIDGGLGEVIIRKSNLNNLDLDMGVGKFSLTVGLSGNSKINQGVGSIDLNLVGSKDDYKIHIDKGLGAATINGNNVKDDENYGNGINKINIDGGVGSINVDFDKGVN